MTEIDPKNPPKAWPLVGDRVWYTSKDGSIKVSAVVRSLDQGDVFVQIDEPLPCDPSGSRWNGYGRAYRDQIEPLNGLLPGHADIEACGQLSLQEA